MILTTAQAKEVAAHMETAGKISVDFRVAGSYSERFRVVHEPGQNDKVLVWQTVGGIVYISETYDNRAAFLAAYSV